MGGWNLMTICSSTVRLLCWSGGRLKLDVVILRFSLPCLLNLPGEAYIVEGPL
ncbi:hypothetical protein RHMOL_Rhmol03G0181900 [Rhododendron molle]|uniref:Uncharacterized protein n=1 Tax=Rhododendron molle TaxID=49168 RepID=A0ACC0PFG8_RHOML|nr:hypothetical protein RHMOL_Rhmol03G0181900 [Rhododendron molle]